MNSCEDDGISRTAFNSFDGLQSLIEAKEEGLKLRTATGAQATVSTGKEDGT